MHHDVHTVMYTTLGGRPNGLCAWLRLKLMGYSACEGFTDSAQVCTKGCVLIRMLAFTAT